MAALGIGTGTLVHICAAALGLSAILAASAAAFTAVKIIGALTCCMSIDSSFGGQSACPDSCPHNRAVSMRVIFRQGFFTNVLNPGRAFFLAFLPQFASDSTSKPLAFLFLGVIFNFNGTLWNHWLPGRARGSPALAPSAAFRQWSTVASARCSFWWESALHWRAIDSMETRPHPISDVGAPFDLAVNHLFKTTPAKLYEAWTSGFDRWFAAPGSCPWPEVDSVFFFETEFKPNPLRRAASSYYGRFPAAHSE